MKKIFYLCWLSIIFLGINAPKTLGQVSSHPVILPQIGNPWHNEELLEPAELAGAIKSGTPKATILNIGAVEDLPGAIHIGAVNDPLNMEKLKKTLATLPKSTPVVIYCGCCPFTKCPNIRPAYLELKKLGFSEIKVLDLPNNLKTNWIAKGYPLAKG